MKAQLRYSNQFFVSRKLANQFDPEYPNNDIAQDVVYVEDETLILETLCGRTGFQDFLEVPGGFLILGEYGGRGYFSVTADYQGAYFALNTCTGVNFPACTLVEINSTVGDFKPSPIGAGADYEYEVARTACGFSSKYSGEDEKCFIPRLKEILSQDWVKINRDKILPEFASLLSDLV